VSCVKREVTRASRASIVVANAQMRMSCERAGARELQTRKSCWCARSAKPRRGIASERSELHPSEARHANERSE